MAIAGPQQYAPFVQALRPVLHAERLRGNVGSMYMSDIHDTRPWWQMSHPLDVPAIEAEFEFAPGIEVRAMANGSIILRAADGGAAFGFVGGSSDGWWARRRRAAWWRAWEASPRPRVRIENPVPEYFR